jgi:hypothetical protein
MRRVLLGGMLGGLVLLAWYAVADGILGFQRGIEMKELADERVVYEFLGKHVNEPGRYVCNPEVLPDRRFPGDAPIFAVQYSGLGHDDAGQEVRLGLVIAFLAPTAGAWLLAHASDRIRSRYRSRVLFLAMAGLVAALLGLASRFGISAYAFGDAIALGARDLAAWLLVGLAVASVVKPGGDRAAKSAG